MGFGQSEPLTKRGMRPDAPLSDQAMVQHARELALSLRNDGEARARMHDGFPKALKKISTEAHRLVSIGIVMTPAMEWLTDNIRMVETMSGHLCREKRALLPAHGGEPRIQTLMRELVAHADAQITRDRLLPTIAAFDELQGLWMDEIWSVPQALKMELCAAFASVARRVLAAERDRYAAELWVQDGADTAYIQRHPKSSAFYERALQLMHEQDLPPSRRALEEWLLERDMSAEQVIVLEHEMQAIDRLWLSNIIKSINTIDAIGWSDCFLEISRAEHELLSDPSHIYEHMDESSRAIIREQVHEISRRTGIGELAVARSAVRLASGSHEGGICHFLYDDDGRKKLLIALNKPDAKLPRIVPDPGGRGYIAMISALTALLFAVTWVWFKSFLLALAAIPVTWSAASAVLNGVLTRAVKPRRLLKLKLEQVPDEMRTLVVIPALLSSADRAVHLSSQLEAYGCLETDPNIDFLLLGDFKDSEHPVEDADLEIINAAREAVKRMNEGAGREKYFYLNRAREYSAGSGRYMGHERKRGALMALNALILNGTNAFEAHGADALHLTGRYAYVVTLDADTRMLPGTVKRLVAAIAHPLNRRRVEEGVTKGYGILQPRMELSKRTVTSPFIRLFGGQGGIDSYPTAVSDVFQDFTGVGIYGGKGIYDIKAFQAQIEGRLPDNALVCHDLIEGALAGVGFLGDEALYDGFPVTLSAYYKRMERWTRGDWQLLPFIKSRLPISKLNRYFMAGNLLRSLTAPASLFLIILSAWLGRPQAMLFALIPHLLPALLALPNLPKDLYRSAVAHVCLLPSTSAALLSGIFRALLRLRTRQNMLEWVTSADADRMKEDDPSLYGRIAAILILPGIINIHMSIAVLAFAALFLVGVSWVREMQLPFEKKALSEEHIDRLMGLARDTWRFFETYVPADGPGIPPDNVQLNPSVGVAERTSPTNIGLYLLSCLSAEKLNLLRAEEMIARVGRTVDTLTDMPKWHGQLYNWYDTRTMQPMSPRYVSSVDGGNLAACLLTLSYALRTDYDQPGLADRIEALARNMAFETLYDKKRRLFVIGYDVENERPSTSHYDLLASEARILSYVAIMLGKAGIKNFAHLGKSAVKTPDGQALLSWSGTMFEYLMPDLLMRAPAGSLIQKTNETVVKTQMRAAREMGGIPWGVSESGYHAFDMQMNYQYRAFGLSELSLRGAKDIRVIAPYASILALSVDPEASCENLKRMTALGFTDEYGLYEAVDYSDERVNGGAPFQIVYSHMAHHQGMIMAALANALRNDAIVKYFMGRPEAEALSLLLEEKETPFVSINRRAPSAEHSKKHMSDAHRGVRIAHPDALFPDTHLLYGGGTTYFAAANGAGFLRVNGLMVNRFSEDPARDGDGVYVHIRTQDAAFCATGQKIFPEAVAFRALFDAGLLTYSAKAGALSAKTEMSVSPEDGTLLIRVRLANQSDRPLSLTVTNCFSVALAAQADMKAHPAFHSLFVESEMIDGKALMFTRRPQDEREYPALLHRIDGTYPSEVSWETDLSRLVGRSGNPGDARSVAEEFSGTLGAVLNPCSALRASIRLSPLEARDIFFTISVMPKENVESVLRKPLTGDAAARSEQLAATQARAMLDFLRISPAIYPLLCRAGAYMMYPRLPNEMRGDAAKRNIGQVSGLWAIGVSGDLPIIASYISSIEHLELVREAVHAHEFYRMQGVWCDLLLINEYGNDYEQPIRDALRELIAASHLRELVGEPGGAYPLDGASLTDAQRALIDAMAALIFSGGRGSFAAQLRAQLKKSARYMESALSDMPPAKAALPSVERMAFNGYGGFSTDGRRYIIDLKAGNATPAPWCNVLANESFGALLSERGGVFAWHGNSRNGRLTPFLNDILSEGFGEAAYIVDPSEKNFASLLPGPGPSSRAYRVSHRAGASEFESGAGELSWKVTQFVDAQWPVKCLMVELRNGASKPRGLTLKFFVDWLMGIQQEDARFLTVDAKNGVGYARGLIDGLGFACMPGCAGNARRARMEFLGASGLSAPSGLNEDGRAGMPGDECSVIESIVMIAPGETVRAELLVGWGGDMEEIERLITKWQESGGAKARLELVDKTYEDRLGGLSAVSPDPVINAMLNRFLPYQVLASRVFGRTGLYQSGGAFGFRDQLQDMLALIPIDPRLVRGHLINCASHQFESGDVMHWWHPERTGVRTRISDDLLFLPYVAAHYVLETGDTPLLSESAHYLCDIEIPENREDFYGTPSVSTQSGTIHEHCMRAFRRAARFGEHGLPLMGTGDWNDGMNRIGRGGKGESVWLGEFMIATARLYARVCEDPADAEYLNGLIEKLTEAVEAHGWDGEWYRRAFMDDGTIIGSAETGEHGCRIDAIAQSWAVMAGLNGERARRAMDEVHRQLVDREHGIIKLLTPPFNSDGLNPGYIKGYVPGIRENGGQYTHAACWVVMAFARLHQADRAWEAFEMLLPHNHADSPEKARAYRVEPYVVAADVYGEPPHAGRGGWTWYTGAAAWLLRVAVTELFGYRRAGDRASLSALLPKKWDELSLRVRVGGSDYTLISRRGVEKVSVDGEPTYTDDIALVDDGKAHTALFPVKNP